MANILYSWKFSTKKERSWMWYILAFSVVIGVVVWAFITRQYGLGLIVLLVSGIFFFVENNSEEETTATITSTGLQISNSFYDFSKLSQYVFVNDGPDIVFVRFYLLKMSTNRYIEVDVENQIAQDLSQILPNFLPEWAKQEITFTEKILHFIKL